MAHIQETILSVKEERRILLKKLLDQDKDLVIEEPKNGAQQTFVDDSGLVVTAVKRPYKKRVNPEGKGKKAAADKSMPQTNSPSTAPMQTKQVVQTISVDANGVPIYPITMGNLSIYNLGKILFDRPGYHTENWIYPAGFMSTRVYGHIKEPERKCVYTCKIVDNGDSPRYETPFQLNAFKKTTK